MKKIKTKISELLKKHVNQTILNLFFPKSFKRQTYNKFIKIFDKLSKKNIYFFLRKDSFMETIFLEKGLYSDWEKESLKLWVSLAKNSSIIIDIGANTGIYSLIAQSNNVCASIIAIEPIDLNFQILRQNIIKNKFKIQTEEVALSNNEGYATMYMLKDRLNYMTSVNDDRYEKHPEIQGNIEVIPVQVLIKKFNYIVEKYKLSIVNLIKIDVEGHELAVLQSMEETLKNYHPTILVEVIGDENAIKLDIFFKEMGYEIYLSIDENKGIKVVDKIWDNNHANFLICQKSILETIPRDHFY